MFTLSRFMGGALATLPFAAMSAVPADVTAELTAMKVDGLLVAGAVLVAVIAIAAVKFIRRAI